MFSCRQHAIFLPCYPKFWAFATVFSPTLASCLSIFDPIDGFSDAFSTRNASSSCKICLFLLLFAHICQFLSLLHPKRRIPVVPMCFCCDFPPKDLTCVVPFTKLCEFLSWFRTKWLCRFGRESKPNSGWKHKKISCSAKASVDNHKQPSHTNGFGRRTEVTTKDHRV